MTTVTEEQFHNELIYCAAVSIIKAVKRENEVSDEILERLNKRIAEQLGCRPMMLDV